MMMTRSTRAPSRTNRITLGQLCRELGLARASVLHYEALGLLLPQQRSASGYRLYGEPEQQRARMIRELRAAGLSLADIAALLARSDLAAGNASVDAASLLSKRLLGLSAEIVRLRQQQQLLARLLASTAFQPGAPRTDKASWVALLQQAGFDDAAMRDWHRAFEREQPVDHQAFLVSLGLSAEEIREIREWSRAWRD